MAGDENDLVATMEGLFAYSEARVITAYKVRVLSSCPDTENLGSSTVSTQALSVSLTSAGHKVYTKHNFSMDKEKAAKGGH